MLTFTGILKYIANIVRIEKKTHSNTKKEMFECKKKKTIRIQKYAHKKNTEHCSNK